MDLSDHKTRQQLAETISCDIDDACMELYDDGFRTHLGASQIGDTCARKSWYGFRWVREGWFTSEGDHPGRMARLWERGKEQEINVYKWLDKAGYRVEAVEPESGEQYRFKAIEGHFGGSCDGRVYLPERFGCDRPFLLEIKTCKDGATFNNYSTKGVKQHNEQYYGQMCVYGYMMNLDYAVFIVVNKNNDKLYIEVVELDRNIAEYLLRKAHEIITHETENGPARVSLHPSKFECKWCHFRDICHHGAVELVAKNCRSCKHATAGDDGNWLCGLSGNAVIPEEVLKKGCDHHDPIT